jgi:hypothetical protein
MAQQQVLMVQLLAYWKRQRAPALGVGGMDGTGWCAASFPVYFLAVNSNVGAHRF